MNLFKFPFSSSRNFSSDSIEMNLGLVLTICRTFRTFHIPRASSCQRPGRCRTRRSQEEPCVPVSISKLNLPPKYRAVVTVPVDKFLGPTLRLGDRGSESQGDEGQDDCSGLHGEVEDSI